MENNNNDFFVKLLNPDKLENTQETYPDSFIHLHHENDDSDIVEDNLYIGKCRITDNFNIGNMSESTATIKVGGLEASTLGDLKKKSMSQIVMDMVCPLTYPVMTTSPSISLSYTGSKLIKVGTTLPSKTDIKVTTNSGKWSDGTSYYGSCGEVTLTMNPDKWGEVSEEGKYIISGSGTFSQGDMSKDSHGNDYEQKSGDSVNSNNISISSVYPIYINDSDIKIMSEKLIDYNSEQTLHVEIPSEIDNTLDKFKIYLPSVFTTFDVKQYSDMSGKYDIQINMVLMDGETSKYIRTKELTDTNTGSAKYEIKLKK